MAARGAPARWWVGACISSCALVLAVALHTGSARARGLTAENPIAIHSMLYLGTPLSAKDSMFRETAAIGASTIRLDIALSDVFVRADGRADWSGVDEYVLLARRYHLRVLANILGTPWYMTQCPPGTPPVDSYRCPPADPALWAADAGAVAAHTRGVIDTFEIINEPDGRWAFLGTPQEYAEILSAAYDAIHRANPRARVALGGLMDIGSSGLAWMRAMLATPRIDARHLFDIGNIHVRTRAADAGATVQRWRRFFATTGFNGPLWITEMGYPADPAQQDDPAYLGGAGAQARYLARVIPAMLCSGATRVFVTERDALSGRYASEGVLDTTDPLTPYPRYTRRPAFYLIRTLAERMRRAGVSQRTCRASM